MQLHIPLLKGNKMLKLKYINKVNILYLLISFSVFLSPSLLAKTGETKEKIQDDSSIEDNGAKNTETKERKYIYNPIGKTDPFKSFIVAVEEEQEKEEEKRTELEMLELSQLSISVIIISDNNSWAMVKDNKGKGYVIKEGTPIGINRGVVYKIKEHEIIIREEYTNYKGEKEFREVSKKTLSD